MKTYDRVRVVGHPRAGTHYLRALLEKNFGGDMPDLEIEYGNHPFGSFWELSGEFLTVYIWRRRADAIRSIFRMRDRFGLNPPADPGATEDQLFGVFRATKLCDMWDGDIEPMCTVTSPDGEVEEVVDDPPDALLRDYNGTVAEYLDEHVWSWRRFLRPEIVGNHGKPPLMVLRYEDLEENPGSCLRRLAPLLRSNRTEFEDVEWIVGWQPA